MFPALSLNALFANGGVSSRIVSAKNGTAWIARRRLFAAMLAEFTPKNS